MRLLDIDLDFFLSDIALNIANKYGRLSGKYIPWSEKAVRDFLENKCGLCLTRKIKGKIIKHYDEVFEILRDMYLNGTLHEKIEVVHIDAHADLGLGDSSWFEITTDLLHKNVSDRMYPKKLACGNYLTYAIACRWIEKLVYVTHPKWEQFSDIQWIHMKDFRDNSGMIQLKKYPKGKIPDILHTNKEKPISLEPEVPFEIINYQDYQDVLNFDYIILAQSPSYTPPTSDDLIKIVREYMI